MRKCVDSRTSKPLGREANGEGAREGAVLAGLVGTGGTGQSCLVMACILVIENLVGRSCIIYGWILPVE